MRTVTDVPLNGTVMSLFVVSPKCRWMALRSEPALRARMRLEGHSGTSFDLTVLSYQFAGGDNEFDINWLIICGHVVTTDRSWSFQDPCLLTSEARSLGSWLRRVTNPLAE